jgi:hypothetical protein
LGDYGAGDVDAVGDADDVADADDVDDAVVLVMP